MYRAGLGAEADYSKAKELYEKAIASGPALAQYNLDLMYEEGQGVEQDYAKAIECYKKAADNGNTYAKKKINDMDEQQNPEKFKRWYEKVKAKDNH